MWSETTEETGVKFCVVQLKNDTDVMSRERRSMYPIASSVLSVKQGWFGLFSGMELLSVALNTSKSD